MMDREMTFGNYLTELRKSRRKPLRIAANAIGVSPQFLSEVEKGRKSPLAAEKIKIISDFLELSNAEREALYDLAATGKTRSTQAVAPQDCVDYLMNAPYAVHALRLAKRTGAGEEEWKEFIKKLEKRLERMASYYDLQTSFHA